MPAPHMVGRGILSMTDRRGARGGHGLLSEDMSVNGKPCDVSSGISSRSISIPLTMVPEYANSSLLLRIIRVVLYQRCNHHGTIRTQTHLHASSNKRPPWTTTLYENISHRDCACEEERRRHFRCLRLSLCH